ncbi:MliC family protein [Sphingomonas mollis]|nr:MliC family protein [Sphingomonas sp. BT553]
MMSLIVAGCSTDRLADGRPSVATATYDCGQARIVSARFDNRADRLTLSMAGRSTVLTQQRAASGIWYIGDGAELRGKGRAATVTLPGAAPMECVAR